MSNICNEECNYYTEEYDIKNQNDIPLCIKGNKIKENQKCNDYNNEMTCYDCPESYAIYYEIDDIDHYCKKYNKLILKQTRSVLYKSDFIKNKIDCDKLKNI